MSELRQHIHSTLYRESLSHPFGSPSIVSVCVSVYWKLNSAKTPRACTPCVVEGYKRRVSSTMLENMEMSKWEIDFGEGIHDKRDERHRLSSSEEETWWEDKRQRKERSREGKDQVHHERKWKEFRRNPLLFSGGSIKVSYTISRKQRSPVEMMMMSRMTLKERRKKDWKQDMTRKGTLVLSRT